MIVFCDHCGKKVNREPNRVKRNKNNFCSLDCNYDFVRADPFLFFLYNIKRRARRDNISCEIELIDLYNIWNGQCALTGEKLFVYESFRKNNLSNASVDRINSTIGYFPNNVQWVKKDINRLKQEFSQEEFISLCNQVSIFNASRRNKI